MGSVTSEDSGQSDKAFAAGAKPPVPDMSHQGDNIHDGAKTKVSEDPSNHPSRDLG